MNSITSNEFTVKDTFCFAKEKVERDSSLVMGSLYVDSLFTNIPLDETINVCTNTVNSEQDIIQGINKEELRNLLSPATKSPVLFSTRSYVNKGWSCNEFSTRSNLANAFLYFF